MTTLASPVRAPSAIPDADSTNTVFDDADAVQLALPFGEQEKHREQTSGAQVTLDTSALDAAVDDLRSRFGAGALTRGVLLGRADHGEVPKLPD